MMLAEFAVWVPLIAAVGFVVLCLAARRPSAGRHWVVG